MSRLTARTSTIFIATDKGTRVYRSPSEIPAALRRKLQASTAGMNSATILIADKRGREELVRALQGQPSDVQCRLADAIRSRHAAPEPPAEKPRTFLRRWLEVLLPVALGASIWFFIDSRF